MVEDDVLKIAVNDELFLKGLEEPEAEALFALTEANRAYLRQWLPWVDGTKTANDTRAFILATRLFADHDKGYTYGLWHHGELIGVIGTHAIDWPNHATALGYWIGERFQGQGIVTRACEALIRHLVKDHQIHRLQICCATGNLKSQAIPKRLGFRQEGLLRDAEWVNDHFVDLVMFSRLATDPPLG